MIVCISFDYEMCPYYCIAYFFLMYSKPLSLMHGLLHNKKNIASGIAEKL